MHILWVENHSRFVSVARQFLAGHKVVVVPSIGEARDASSRELFDAALVDFDLDDGKGDVLVRELRRRFPALLVIATSSHEAGNEALLCAGAHAVCGKLDFSRIQSVLQSAAGA